jgi:hypothetical protein
MEKVYPWAAIEPDFQQGLILGNGASIAFDQRFRYNSLKTHAGKHELLTPDVLRVFRYLKTDDFELVLRMLWHANKINMALEIPDDRTTQAYVSVRDALIETVRAIHVRHEEVGLRLPSAAAYMGRFSTVASLSYDVLVYWAMLVGNENAPNRFKDCFISGAFDQDWKRLRRPWRPNSKATLVFYPHGSLAIGADLAGVESKLQADEGEALLGTVFDKWRAGDTTPVFVSEGTSEQKRAAIRRSPYLSTVYEEVLPDLGDTVVVLGWSIHQNDHHLLDAICSSQVRAFAVAVNRQAADLAESQERVRRELAERMRFNKFELTFFDRDSDDCWINPRSTEVDY